ncbi:aminoglycoside 6-adenylyltransferase [Enterococcus sp.]|uniref:aminoglycoside 6-adenylyltransferase n=1 Tax=Enterococcus sp. TaxID=35783 RepID=UPI0025BF4A9C|nr:aminoglycoside 6-adenylyltransferase [Enterococcus sp.]
MRNEAEMTALILQVGQEIGVQAIAISGSRQNPQVKRDRFQDYDIVYIVDNLPELLAEPSWLKKFGPLMIMQTPETSVLSEPSLGGRFTFLMHFEDGNRIDLMLCPLELIHLLQEEPFLERLYDPKELLEGMDFPDGSVYWIEPPTEAAFYDSCNEFWWVATYVVKGLVRNQLLYATDHLYQICWQELLRQYDWYLAHQAGYHFSTGKNHKDLPLYLSEEAFQRLTTLDFSSIASCGESLWRMAENFDEIARKVSRQHQFSYHEEEAEKVKNYIHQWRSKAWRD